MVELLDHYGSDWTVVNAARVSFSGEEWAQLPEGYTEEQGAKLISYLSEHKHMCPFRHPQITIRCEAPVFLARQLGKHQIGLVWSEESRRYRDHAPDFYVPLEWRKRPEGGIKQGSAGSFEGPDAEALDDAYIELLDRAVDLYEGMLEDGVAPEMARMVLPQSMMVRWVWTGSLEAFSHMYKLRIDGHAQKEARDFAQELDTIMKELYPYSWSALCRSS